MPNKQQAINWAINFATDDTHGYSQTRRGGIDGDCSDITLRALRAGGFDTGTATFTGDSLQPLLKNGWVDVTKSVNMRTGQGIQACDVLLRPKTNEKNGHMALAVGNGEIIQSQSDYDGKPGDSSGREIRIQAYYDSPFTYCLRYQQPAQEDGTEVGIIVNCIYFCNRREKPTTNSAIVGKAPLGQECRFNGRHRTNGEIWLHDTIGNWISASFVQIDYDKLPWM